MNYSMSVEKIKSALREKLSHSFGVTPENASDDEYYKAAALILREYMAKGRAEMMANAQKQGTKRIYYLCMEFLLGRSLRNTLFNLNLEENMRKALKEMDIDLEKLYLQEPDAGLGNGGLGRLAACFLDSLATQEYPAIGYCLLYEYGMFRQKLVEGWQTELPDFWLPGGKIWLQRVTEKSIDVHFGGHVEEQWHDSYHSVRHKDYHTITAVPYDMYVAGKDGKGISLLRVWKAETNQFDMKLFNGGNYLRAMEETSMAEVVTKVLYPEDNHQDGKLLRLTQQYFLVSASVQDIIRRHLLANRSLDNLPQLAAIHLNDTHPVLAIPEMMRIMLDECGYGWEDAWSIVQRTLGYTNHTVMAEALECWSVELFQIRLPRIYQIIQEINRRFQEKMQVCGTNPATIKSMAPISDGYIKMANLAVIGTHNINGVSALHSEILKNDVFQDFYRQMPNKFTNVTNGIAYRRWLCQANPALSALVTELVGDKFIYNAAELSKLVQHQDDKAVLEKLEKIKKDNKIRLAHFIKKKQGITLDPDSIFDVQIKRLHEYKRQHMNAMEILATYQWLRDNPDAPFHPHTYIFGAKAAAGYYYAKQIIQFIAHLGEVINNDPRVNQKMRVVFVENYSVSWAELLTPAADISEQISLAGTEASGTSNMKFMINGAITLGTLDGANVEIHEAVGDQNMILFGMTASQAEDLRRSGYRPETIYHNNESLRRVMDEMQHGFGGKAFPEVTGPLLHQDQYMALADFSSFSEARKRTVAIYGDRARWNKMSLINIANAGRFSADRAIKEYAENIWHAKPISSHNTSAG